MVAANPAPQLPYSVWDWATAGVAQTDGMEARGTFTMERRSLKRRAVGPEETLRLARLRTGGELQVIDASVGGVLVETRERLLPGRDIQFHLVAYGGRELVRAHVIRAYVCWLKEDAIAYRVGLAFDRLVDTRPDGDAVPVFSAGEGKQPFATPWNDLARGNGDAA